jgi:peroxiredoxin
MAAKLGTGDSFPRLTLKLTDGGSLELPAGLDAKYTIILFYRGHW